MLRPGRDLSWKEFFVSLKRDWLANDLGNVAGALTFFSVLALFPFLLCLVALAGLLMDPTRVGEMLAPLSKVAPQPVVQIVGDRLRLLAQSKSVGILTLSALVTIYSASGATMSLIDALDKANGVKDSRSYLKRRLLAAGMTLVTAALALLAGMGAVALLPVANAIGGPLGMAIGWLRLPVAAFVMIVLWAVLYYVLPDVEQRFRLISPGSVVGVLLWALASWGFSQYVAHFSSYDVIYGALGGVVVLLLWMWISSLVVLLGAEINAILEHSTSKRARESARTFIGEGLSGTKREERAPRERPGPAFGSPERATKRAVEYGLAALVFRLLRRPRA